MAKKIKQEGDLLLSALQTDVANFYKTHKIQTAPLPFLASKITISQGYQVMELSRKIYVGDAVNYCCRVASQAFFNKWNEGIILTDKFFEVMPPNLKEKCHPYATPLELENYPRKGAKSPITVYRVPLMAV
jgi:hypothetical protein